MKLASRVSAVFFFAALDCCRAGKFGIWNIAGDLTEIVDFFVKLERNIFFRQIDF